MNDDYLKRVVARGIAVADGRIPDSVDPESEGGWLYSRMIEHVRADVAAAPPLPVEAMAIICTLLRDARGDAEGGGRRAAA